MDPVPEQLRKAIAASGKTGYRVSKEAGVAKTQVSRLLRGERSVSVATAEKLAAVLGMELVLRPKDDKRRGRGRKGR